MTALAPLFSLDAVVLVAGIAALYLGAEALVEGAARLAVGFGLHAAVVGVTVVAFATTTPELAVAVVSGLGYSTDLGLGAIVGSNIANIGLVLGVAALIQPMGVARSTLRRHVPFMVTAAVLLVALGSDGTLGALDGLLLLALLAAFTGTLVYRVRSAHADAAAPVDDVAVDGNRSPHLRDFAYLAVGLALLLVGSRWLIRGGSSLLYAYGFGPRFVGLTVLAFGTSLPELAASVVSAVRGEAAFSIGNVVGSNIYNVVAVLGVLTLLVPVSVPPSTISFDFPALLAFTFGLLVLMVRGRDVTRLDGALLLCGYAGFVTLLL